MGFGFFDEVVFEKGRNDFFRRIRRVFQKCLNHFSRYFVAFAFQEKLYYFRAKRTERTLKFALSMVVLAPFVDGLVFKNCGAVVKQGIVPLPRSYFVIHQWDTMVCY